MSAPAWKDVRALVERALDLEPAARDELLREWDVRDAPLALAARELLAHARDDDAFLAPPLASPLAARTAAPAHGSCIAGFTIVRELGSGGMGTVYEAEQQSPRRSVALKLLRVAAATPDMLRRFEYEAAVLARLRHPGIAQIHGAGVHRVDGPLGAIELPWIAMELIEDALDVATHCKRHALDTRATLLLFAQVCAAVQHGHEKGVIHRDLKPANILVDASGRARVIDFGVARAVHAEPGDDAPRTLTGMWIGTLRYMSPEQLGGDLETVDTRSDVYALGVVLYELVCEAPPYPLDGKSLSEAARCVRELPAQRPRAHRPALAREIEWILLKALEKDPERRYASAAELGDDIRRAIADLPVRAAPPSAAYRFSKLVQRNRIASAFAAAALAALLGGAVASLLGWREANRQRDDAYDAREDAKQQAELAEQRRAQAEEQRDVARNEADKATAIGDFLAELIRSTNPELAGKDARIADALRAKAGDIPKRFAAQPAVRAMLHRHLGESFLALGLGPEAEHELREAWAVGRAAHGEHALETLDAQVKLAQALDENGRDDEALPLATGAYEDLRAQLGERASATLTAQHALGSLYIGRREWPLAEPVLRRTLELKREVYGPRAPDTAATMNDLAVVLRNTGRMQEAETLLRDAHAIWLEQQGEWKPRTLAAEANLVGLLVQTGKQVEALPLSEHALEGSLRTLGEDHTQTLATMDSHAILLERAGRLEEAEALYRRVLALRIPKQGEDDPDTLSTKGNLASLLSSLQRHAEAEPLTRSVYEARLRALGPEARSTLISMQNLASCLRRQARYAEADLLLSKCVEIRTRTYGERDSETIAALGGLGSLRQMSGDLASAQELLGRAIELARETLEPDHYYTRTFELELGRCLSALGRFDDAEPLLEGAYASHRARFGDNGPATRIALQALVQHYDARGLAERAAEYRRRL